MSKMKIQNLKLDKFKSKYVNKLAADVQIEKCDKHEIPTKLFCNGNFKSEIILRLDIEHIQLTTTNKSCEH